MKERVLCFTFHFNYLKYIFLQQERPADSLEGFYRGKDSQGKVTVVQYNVVMLLSNSQRVPSSFQFNEIAGRCSYQYNVVSHNISLTEWRVYQV